MQVDLPFSGICFEVTNDAWVLDLLLDSNGSTLIHEVPGL
jgi:hypothetical protein